MDFTLPRRHVALALGLLVAVLGLPVAAHAAEAPAPVVTWPSVTRFNPTLTTYTLSVDDTAAGDAGGDLYASWAGDKVLLPHQGDFAMPFASDGYGTIDIERCVADVCTATGVSSPLLDVRRAATVSAYTIPDLSRELTLTAGYTIDVQGGLQSGRWWVTRAGGGPEIVSGNLTSDQFQITLPFDTTDGDYLVWTEGTVGTYDYGTLVAAPHSSGFTIDRTPATATVSMPSSFNPVVDGYRDVLRYTVTPNEHMGSVEAQVFGPTGAEWTWPAAMVAGAGEPVVFDWDGRSAFDGSLAPEGRYTVRISLLDAAGNTSTINRLVTVDHARLQTRTFRRTVTAAGSTIDAHVGRCSVLRRPSLRGWSGSLGYYSNKRCRAGSAASQVGTVNGVAVPKAFEGRYGKLAISTYGGAARRYPRSNLGFGVLRAPDLAVVGLRRLGPALGSHSSGTLSAANLVHDRSTHPSVLWSVGSGGGQRYDVKSFTVTLTYTVLA